MMIIQMYVLASLLGKNNPIENLFSIKWSILQNNNKSKTFLCSQLNSIFLNNNLIWSFLIKNNKIYRFNLKIKKLKK
jgi:hypothetical protein